MIGPYAGDFLKTLFFCSQRRTCFHTKKIQKAPKVPPCFSFKKKLKNENNSQGARICNFYI
jgi:hypothetical protein